MIRTISARLAGLRACATLALLLVAAPAWALQVSNSNDSGSGSLRAAVAAGGTVTFAVAMDNQTITLSSAPISIPAGTSINGPGADRLTISGGNARRMFVIATGVNGVSISGLRLSNGFATVSGQGGAIHNLGGLTLNGVAVIGNTASDAGGAVYNRGQLQIYASSFSGNTVNGTTCAGGGAIRSEGAGSQLRIESSTISGNSATSCNGGGVSFTGGSAAIISSTLFGNSAGSSGGNLYKGSVASVLSLSASVISDGSAGGGLPLNADLHGARIGGLTSAGFNLVRARGDGLGFVASDLADGTDPQLGVLASNSGTTASHALAGTSPLRDAQTSPCPSSTDQRGVARPQGAGCDVGAYELRQNRLTVNVAAGGTVSAAATPAPLGSAISGCSGSCTADYEAETPALVTLIASPQPGHVLLGWSGDCSGTASSTTVSMGQARSCSAAFASTDVVVTPIAGPNGALSPATPQTIAYGSSTAFSVSADANHHVLSVTGCGGSLSGTTFNTGAVTADCSVSATFAIDTFTVSSLAIGGGSVSPAVQTVNYGQSATLTLTPDANHHLVSATGCGGNLSGNTFTTAMVTADCAVTATFAIDRHTVTASASASGNGTITPLSQTVDHGQIATLILAPAANHHIVSVTGCGGSLSGNTFTTAAVVTDCVVTATFAIDRFTVTASATGNGTITPLSQDIDYDGIASLIVVPAANHHIVSVSGCGGSLSGSTFTTAAITASCAVEATFAIDRHTVTASASGNGSITPPSQDVDHDGIATLTVTAAANHHIVSVTGCGGSLSGDTFTTAAITADCAVTATFAIDRFTVTASATGNGTITPLSQDVDHNAIATLTVTAAANHHIVSVSGCGGSLAGDTFTTAAVTADCTVEATFAIDRHTVTASASGNGSITPPSQDVDHDGIATLTVTAAANHHIVSVTGCGGSLSGDTFTTAAITADCAVTATFAIDRFTVTASATGNGTLTPPSQQVDWNAIASLTVTPAANHHVVSVSGCGGSLSGSTFTTAPVTADCAVQATFAVDTHTIGGSVEGLLGSGLTLQLNGGQDLVIAANGVFQFPGVADALTSYSVTVAQQPTAPRQLCTVANGSGTVGGLDINNVLVSCDLPQALLSVQVDDGRSYVRYGMLVNYVVTVSNSGDGDASGVLVSDLVSTAMDAPFIRWYCFGAGAGADCAASGTGPLYDASVRVPAGRSLSWLVTAPVRLLAPEGLLNYQVTAQGSNVSSDSDEDTLVILRTGADQPYGDGAEGAREGDSVATDVPAAALCRFDLARTYLLNVPATPATSAVETLARMRGANAAGFRIERHSLAATPQVRVVTIDQQGGERAGEWARATGATLSLGSVLAEDGTRVLLIEGTEPLLSEPLPAGTAAVLQWQLPARGSLAPVCPTDSAE